MLVHKLKAVVVFLLNLIKKAFVCFRRRRKVSVDVVPLTAVGVVPAASREMVMKELGNWNNWGEDSLRDRAPQTIQEHIENYRSRSVNPSIETTSEQMADFFEDMEPRIKKQPKILLTSKDAVQSRLAFVPPSTPVDESGGELKSWEERESRGGPEAWGEIDAWDTEEMLREKRRQEKLTRKDHPPRPNPLVTAS